VNRRSLLSGVAGLSLGLLASTVYWRDVYRYTAVEIKCWVQIDERRGFETVPLIRLNISNWFYAVGADNPLRLDSRYSYVIEAPEKRQDWVFVGWQSEKTGVIVPDPRLRLDAGFESDTWWQNYAVKNSY
jgi:hypothetical protein